MSKRRKYIPPLLKGKLEAGKRKSRRDTVYKFIGKKNDGMVPCFVCKRHVKEENATLEHIIPLSKGGSDTVDNLSISHYQCNKARGSDENFSWDKPKEDGALAQLGERNAGSVEVEGSNPSSSTIKDSESLIVYESL